MDDDALAAPLGEDDSFGDSSTAGAPARPRGARGLLTDGIGPLEADEPLPSILGYDILAEVGAGGQAVVYEATQVATGRRVAIKVLPGGRFAGSRQRERFERETTVLASVQHPHVVGIVDRGRTRDGSFYFVMPFVGGAELDDHVEARRAAGEAGSRELLTLFARIADAVAEAHRLGVVHRDLKPSNVRVDERGNPYVLDFGLARPRAELGADDWRARTITSDGQVVGSLPWASPEQAAGDRVGVRSDVYSLGVMLYQALTGVFPYPVRGQIRQVLDHIATTVPAAPSRRHGGVDGPTAAPFGPERPWPPDLADSMDAVVLRCLAKAQADRYPSARELADDLDRLLAGKPVDSTTARVVSIDAPASSSGALKTAVLAEPRRVSRRPRGGSVLAGCGVAVALAVAGLWAAMRPTPGRLTVEVVRLPVVRNAAGMQMLRVPGTAYNMGSPRREAGRGNGEDQRPATVPSSFSIARTEVTRGQFKSIMGRYPEERPGLAGADAAANRPAAQRELDDQLPATPVSWDDAVEFCRLLSLREPGTTYRLPTEAEWEYACRAGMVGPFGGTGRLDDMGWYAGNSSHRLSIVGRKAPNHWGLLDMHGGVDEWCQDPYDSVPRSAATSTAPTGERIEAPPAYKVVRGGSIEDVAADCRSAARRGRPSGIAAPNSGFRPVSE